MDEKTKKRRIKSYITTVLSLLVAIGVCLYAENPFGAEGAKDVIKKVCNAFTVPGVLFAGISLLTFLASLGAYDSLGYTFSNFSLHNIWFSAKQPKKYKNFYEYKTAKDEKGRYWWRQGLVVGLASLFVSVVLLIVYFIL